MTETDATRLAAAARALEETKAAQRAMIAQMRAKLNALETALGDPTPVSPFAPLDPPAPPDVAGARMATAASGSRYQGRDDVLLA
ncbi:MAG: bifunctional ornithine acetyltransferase/N-acetylglutamate synthase, partial [Pseudomonadota bacterium]